MDLPVKKYAYGMALWSGAELGYDLSPLLAKKIFDLVAFCPVPHDFPLGCGFGILGRGDMIDDGLDFAAVKNMVHTLFQQIHNGDRGSYFMAHDNVEVEDHIILCRFITEMCCKYLFSYCLSHCLRSGREEELILYGPYRLF